MLVSLLILILNFNNIGKWIQYSSPTTIDENSKKISLISYNVRLFNLYKWIPNQNGISNILNFVKKEQPDIVCIQEFNKTGEAAFKKHFQYHHLYYLNNSTSGQAIFSNFPIINKGVLSFEDTSNNILFVDLKYNTDTIRVYSIHLESLHITNDIIGIEKEINQQKSEKIFRKIATSFKRQEQQVEALNLHRKNCKYPTIISGDLNNNAFSYTYKNVKNELNDAFLEKGFGFGKTYYFKYFPFRIDYIFTDKRFKISNFKTYNNIKHSDHYPIKAVFTLDK
ncbi:MAG: endonuclease/exonuclease/phosphatase family protein [Bacteroidota bacterium]|nr:endonuclease/exonuclease/phosphatase family protein [Bacteroidota bacterium]